MIIEKQLPYGLIQYDKDNCIVKTRYNDGLNVDLKVAKKVRSAIYEITGKDKFGIYSDMSGIIMLEREARLFLGEDPENRIIASAVLVRNILHKNFVNLFVNFSKRQFDLKSFTSEEEAINWLKEKTKAYCSQKEQTTDSSKLTKIEEDFATFEYKEDDCIVISKYKKDIVINKEMAQKAREDIFKLTNSASKIGILTDFTEILMFEMEVKDVALQNPEGKIKATAILVDNDITENLIKMFTSYENPDYKVKIFRDYDEAYNWLKDELAEFC